MDIFKIKILYNFIKSLNITKIFQIEKKKFSFYPNSQTSDGNKHTKHNNPSDSSQGGQHAEHGTKLADILVRRQPAFVGRAQRLEKSSNITNTDNDDSQNTRTYTHIISKRRQLNLASSSEPLSLESFIRQNVFV